MPFVNLKMTNRATREQKETIVREFTEILVRVLGKKPETTHIVIEEIEEENWGVSGMLSDDFRRSREK
jgi:4-oxalocrotonate tautomerase